MINFLNNKDEQRPFTLIFGNISKATKSEGKTVVKSITGIIKFKNFDEAEYIGEQLIGECLQENYAIISNHDFSQIIFSHE